MVGRGPVHIVATDAGATIALKLAQLRPDQVRSLNLHEPSLTGLLADDAIAAPLYAGLRDLESSVVARLESRDALGAAQAYVDRAAAEPGGWAQLPPECQRTFLQNAGATLREFQDAALQLMDLGPFATHREPIVLTGGSRSAPGFAAINEHVAGGFYHALRYSYDGASHFPHTTHPDQFVHVTDEFCRFAAQQPSG
jgi:lipase